MLKRIISISLVTMMLAINFVGTAFAFSTSATAVIDAGVDMPTMLDMDVASNGDAYILGYNNNVDLGMWFYDKSENTLSSMMILEESITPGYEVYGSIALDGNDYPAVSYITAWTMSEPYAFNLYYRQYSGSGDVATIGNWDARRTIETHTTASLMSQVQLGFFTDDTPSVLVMGSEEYSGYLVEYLTNDDFASNATAYQVSSDSLMGGFDSVINSSDEHYVVYSTASSHLVYMDDNQDGVWSLDTTLSTPTSAMGALIDVYATGYPHVAYTDMNGGTTTMYHKSKSEGGWGSAVEVTTSMMLGAPTAITTDTGNDYPYVGVYDMEDPMNAQMILYYSTDGSSFSSYETGIDISTKVFGYDTNGTQFWMAGTENSGFTTNLYAITDLGSGGGGGGGEGVPEFSTWMYILTIILAFGLVYKTTNDNRIIKT